MDVRTVFNYRITLAQTELIEVVIIISLNSEVNKENRYRLVKKSSF